MSEVSHSLQTTGRPVRPAPDTTWPLVVSAALVVAIGLAGALQVAATHRPSDRISGAWLPVTASTLEVVAVVVLGLVAGYLIERAVVDAPRLHRLLHCPLPTEDHFEWRLCGSVIGTTLIVGALWRFGILRDVTLPSAPDFVATLLLQVSAGALFLACLHLGIATAMAVLALCLKGAAGQPALVFEMAGIGTALAVLVPYLAAPIQTLPPPPRFRMSNEHVIEQVRGFRIGWPSLQPPRRSRAEWIALRLPLATFMLRVTVGICLVLPAIRDLLPLGLGAKVTVLLMPDHFGASLAGAGVAQRLFVADLVSLTLGLLLLTGQLVRSIALVLLCLSLWSATQAIPETAVARFVFAMMVAVLAVQGQATAPAVPSLRLPRRSSIPDRFHLPQA